MSHVRACYFGSPGRRCFGWLHVPTGMARATGVVLVGPFGEEAISAHRALRRLAERLAQEGFPVLRYDHPGTGDSEGSDRDPGRVRAWLDGVSSAITELCESQGVAQVSLFGLRLGATLATIAAAERSDVASLVLWAPCSTGRAYLREVRARHLLKSQEEGAVAHPAVSLRAGDEESGGFLLTAELIADLGGLSALTLARRPAPRALVVGRDDLPDEGRLVKALAGVGVALDHRAIAGYVDMMQDAHLSVVPEQLFHEMSAWLAAVHPDASPSPASPHPLTAPTALDLGAVRETPLSFDGGRLVGILAEPTASAGAGRTCLVLTNPGAVHRIGVNRLHVTFARAWAAQGLPVLRLDVGGIGDSRPAAGNQENDTYAPTAAADVKAALRELGARGFDRFVMMGLCSGAYVAYHAALTGTGVVTCVLLNPQTFYWKQGDSLSTAKSQVARHAAHYRQALFRPESWAKAFRGRVDVQKLAGVLVRRAQNLASARLRELKRLAGWRTPPGKGDVAADLRSIVASGTELLMVFSAGDPGLDYVAMEAGGELAALRRRPEFRLDIVEGADHTFTSRWSQDVLQQILSDYLLEKSFIMREPARAQRAALAASAP